MVLQEVGRVFGLGASGAGPLRLSSHLVQQSSKRCLSREQGKPPRCVGKAVPLICIEKSLPS